MMKVLSGRVYSFLLILTLTEAGYSKGNMTDLSGDVQQANEVLPVVKTTFHMYVQGNVFEDTCAIIPFRMDTLYTCNYNTSGPLVIIIHGWSLNGKMEEWMFKMASALKSRLENVNVLIIDWRPLALKSYPTAAKNSRQVGWDVATLLKWLEESTQLSMDKVHLIGYSLGAHVAGFAGSHFNGSIKLGRITGLDPAGPQFEGVPDSDRLSPNDANFVDAIHTFSKSGFGLAVGIRQTVGHADFYPNGGSFQPGCLMTGLPKTFKCTHQRAVHLFIDSIQNQDKQMIAYRCRDDKAFDRGMCMDCKQNRCNTLGYDVQKVYTGGKSKGLYLKTGSQSPFKVYHYQIKVQLMNVIEPVNAPVSIAIEGTEGQSHHMPVTLSLEFPENKTYSSLATVDSPLGKLQAVRLRWEGGESWSSWWRRVTNMMGPSEGTDGTELSVAKIRLKSGESQEKTWFCAPSGEVTMLKPSQEQEFVRCQDISKRKRSTTSLRHYKKRNQ